MARSSSSSVSTPSLITRPRLRAIGASVAISRSMRERMPSHGLSCSPIARSVGSSEARQRSRTGPMAESAWRSCTSSRGLTRPTATLEISRSRSPICSSCERSVSRSSGLRKKYSTTSRRWLMAATSLSGKRIQRRSRRPPMGLTVRSRTSSRLLPSGAMALTSSRLRTVKLSSRT